MPRPVVTIVTAKEVTPDDLPQGPGFRFVQRIICFDQDQKGHARIKFIYEVMRRGLDWEQAHFPDNPIFPGVLIAEMAAQGAILLVKQLGLDKGGLPFLANMEADFKQAVPLGTVLTGEVILVRHRARCFKLEFAIYTGSPQILVATGKFTGVIVNAPNPD